MAAGAAWWRAAAWRRAPLKAESYEPTPDCYDVVRAGDVRPRLRPDPHDCMLDIPAAGISPILLESTSLNIPVPLAVALFVGGLFGYAAVNAIEIAVVASNRIRIQAAAEEGSQRAAAVERLKEQQDVFFGLVVILQNVSVFLASTAGTVLAVRWFGSWGYLVSLVAIPLISAEFGEYTPKVIASRAAERIAMLVARAGRDLRPRDAAAHVDACDHPEHVLERGRAAHGVRG